MLLKYGVPLLVTVGLCFMLFTGVDIREMIRIVRSDCNFFWIAAGLALIKKINHWQARAQIKLEI